MQRVAVLNIVGLTPRLIGDATPNLRSFLEKHPPARVRPAFPAVTCTAQSTYLTGLPPAGHGIVANGWYDRDYDEHRFWKQSNHLVQGEKLWEALRRVDPDHTCAKLFWWFNMYSSADYSITPRPLYPADGRKVFDVHTWPSNLRERIKADLGPFPFPQFWGPAAGIKSTEWIAASAKWIEERVWPSLSLVYLPHLDYNMQRCGLDFEKINGDLQAIDRVAGDLIRFYEARNIKPVLLSEYGITSVTRPVHLNRLFRKEGWITVKNELGLETLELGESRVFAIADHQVAHVYVQDKSLMSKVRTLLEGTPGIEHVLGAEENHNIGLDHARSGDLVAVADAESWFTYYFWLDDELAPDFARCVDIHRKCGYDPVELFLDPAIKSPKLKIAGFLMKKTLGFRTMLDVIPLDANLVKGSHGRIPEDTADWPLLAGDFSEDSADEIEPGEVFTRLFRLCSERHGYSAPAL